MSFRALAVAAVALLLLAGCQTPAPPSPPDPPRLSTSEERFSYAVGAKLGTDLRRSAHPIDRALLLRGVEDGLAGGVALSNGELAAALQEGVAQQREREEALRAERARAAQEEGRAFLARNRERPGVVALENGLQYEVLRKGTGPVPSSEDFVICNTRGSLLDGSVFDDTAALGRPRTFAVTSVVDGLEQALVRMPVGSRWKVWVPPELGYGASRPGAKVPPEATLVFEIELLSIGAAPRR